MLNLCTVDKISYYVIFNYHLGLIGLLGLRVFSTLSGCGCIRDGLDKEGGAFFPIIYPYIHPTVHRQDAEERKEVGEEHPAMLQPDSGPAGTEGMLPDNTHENTSRLLAPDNPTNDNIL